MGNEVANFFSPASQQEFWDSYSPNLVKFIKFCEKSEDWTYSFDEIPEVFIKFSESLPSMAAMPISPKEISGIVQDLIPILSAMEYGTFLSSFVFLENKTEAELGWGIYTYIEAINLSKNEGHPLQIQAQNIVERVNIGLGFQSRCNLFVKGDLFLKIKESRPE